MDTERMATEEVVVSTRRDTTSKRSNTATSLLEGGEDAENSNEAKTAASSEGGEIGLRQVSGIQDGSHAKRGVSPPSEM